VGILATAFAGQLRAENEQVQIDLVFFAVKPEAAKMAGMIVDTDSGPKGQFRLISNAQRQEWLQKLIHSENAKVLAEPKLVTLSGQRARVLCGGQQAVLTGRPKEGEGTPAMGLHEVGTSAEILPRVMEDGKVYLEIDLRIKSVNSELGTQTSFGFIPGFSEQGIRAAATLADGESYALMNDCPHPCSNLKGTVCLVLLTPHVISSSPVVHASVQEPAHAQIGRIAAVLATEYRQACAAGDKDLAAKLGRMALELDPLCLGLATAPAVPRTLPAPMPAIPMPVPTPPVSEDNEYRTPIIPAVREDQPPPACPEPSEKEIIDALNARTGSPRLKLEDVGDEVEIVCEKVMDKVDEPRFFPLVGPARLHHCHWKCTVYYNETVRSNKPFPMVVKNKHVEVVYIDKDVLHPTDSESKPATVPVKAEEPAKKQSFRERFRSLFKSNSVVGMTLPSRFYLQPKPQFFRPDPDFPLEKELEAMQEENVQKQAPKPQP
jgi:hypothetical protein